jgi:1,4-alpha-glucan branching enzyme
VTFRTWAPNASSVMVRGTFNGWGETPLFSEGGGYWSRDVSGAAVGDRYKFTIDGLWRRDPYGREIEGGGDRNSVVYDPAAFDWGTNTFTMAPAESLVIYEMHVGSFFDPDPNDGLPGTLSNALQKLDHLVALGINAVELMPISEFPTDTSWGYNLSYPFAIETRYGRPEDVKAFVKACHERGIAVLMDVVYNHWGDDNNDWSLWQYDGWSENGRGGIFFYNDDINCCTPWGPRPNYGSADVRRYIEENMRMWKAEYRMDGFRWDAPKYILYTDGDQATEIPDGAVLVDQIITMLENEFPGTLNIAEDIKGVLGFDSYWDFEFQGTLQNMMAESEDSARNMNTLAYLLDQSPQRIIYTESHDTTGDLNNGARFPVRVAGWDPEGYFGVKRTLLGAALTMTAAGTPMVWQGQEMLATNVFNDATPLDWSRTNQFAGVNQAFADLIHLRRDLLGVTPGLSGDQTTIRYLNQADNMILYERYRLAAPEEKVVVVANLSNTARTDYPVPFPEAGMWYVHANTDDSRYFAEFEDVGSSRVEATGAEPTGAVDVGRYSVLVLSQTPVSALSVPAPLFVDGPDGNTNGVVEPGETIQVQVTVTNTGDRVLSNIVVTLRSEGQGVTVLTGEGSLAQLDAGEGGLIAAPLAFRMPTNWVCGQAVGVELDVQVGTVMMQEAYALPVGSISGGGQVLLDRTRAAVNAPITDNNTTTDTLVIDASESGAIEDLRVRVRLDHTYLGDLILRLFHPDGTEVLLANRRGSFHNDYGAGACGADVDYVIFDAAAAESIVSAPAPFSGTYRPEGQLAALAGKPVAGEWQLTVSDLAGRDQGTLLCWGLEINVNDLGYTCEVWQTTSSEPTDSDSDGLPDDWELEHGDDAVSLAPEDDLDADGASNLQEYRAGTDPNVAGSVLRLEPARPVPGSNGWVAVSWSSVSNRYYRLWRANALTPGGMSVVHSNIPATPPRNTLHDDVGGTSTLFYRIEVE